MRGFKRHQAFAATVTGCTGKRTGLQLQISEKVLKNAHGGGESSDDDDMEVFDGIDLGDDEDESEQDDDGGDVIEIL